MVCQKACHICTPALFWMILISKPFFTCNGSTQDAMKMYTVYCLYTEKHRTMESSSPEAKTRELRDFQLLKCQKTSIIIVR